MKSKITLIVGRFGEIMAQKYSSPIKENLYFEPDKQIEWETYVDWIIDLFDKLIVSHHEVEIFTNNLEFINLLVKKSVNFIDSIDFLCISHTYGRKSLDKIEQHRNLEMTFYCLQTGRELRI